MIELMIGNFNGIANCYHGFFPRGGREQHPYFENDFGPYGEDEIYVRNEQAVNFYPILIVTIPFDVFDSAYRIHNLIIREYRDTNEITYMKLIAQFLTEEDAMIFQLTKP